MQGPDGAEGWRGSEGAASGGEDESGINDSEGDTAIEQFGCKDAIRSAANAERARRGCIQREHVFHELPTEQGDGIRLGEG